jgi:5-methylcytosine-specific restriction enzyme subunit McrC
MGRKIEGCNFVEQMIPVKNIYYMLSYAFSALRSQGYKHLGSEEFENISDLMCEILTKGISSQVKRGLIKLYVLTQDITSSPKGKIEVSESIKRNSVIKQTVVCSFDEFTANVFLNRTLKTAGLVLMKSDATPARKKKLRRCLDYLVEIEPMRAVEVNQKYRFTRQTATYEMLLSICRLIVNSRIASSSEKSLKIEDFDEENLAYLYEKFLLEYFKKEHAELVDVSSPHIPWAVEDGGDLQLLPHMRTDVVLRARDLVHPKTLIIDAKYYSNSLQEYRGVRTLRSGHMYQIYAYVKNENYRLKKLEPQSEVSGMLLYARTNEATLPDERHVIDGSVIEAKTLDLSVDFPEIRKQLDSIVESYFG